MVVSLTKTKSGYEYKEKPHRFTVRKNKAGDWVVRHWGPNIFNGVPVTDSNREVASFPKLDLARYYITGAIEAGGRFL